MTKNEKEGGFISHLTELRTRLINSFIFLFVFFIFCYFFAEYLYGFLVEPYAQAVKDDGTQRRLIFTALQETFLTYVKVAFFASFFITSPFILIQIWKFIAPGLYDHEKSAIMPYLVITPILFFLGGALVYYLVMPLAIKFFLSFETIAQTNTLPIQLEAKVTFSDSGTITVFPPQSSGAKSRSASSCLTRSGLASALSILFIATRIGTSAARAWSMASCVWGMTPSSAATTKIITSVTLAPRDRIFVKAS